MNKREITAEDLTLYAMNLLEDHAERRAVELFLSTSPEARQELALIRGDLAMFALGAEMHSPPALARQRLLKEVARERKPLPFAGYDAAASGQQAAARGYQQPPQQEAYPPQTRQSGYHQQQPAYPPQQENYPSGGYSAPLPPQPTEEPQFLRAYQEAARSPSSYEEDAYEEPQRNVVTMVLPWVGWVAAAGLAIFAVMTVRDRDQLNNRYQAQTQRLSEANESAERAQLVVDTLTAPTAQRFILTKQDVHPPSSARVSYLAERGSLLFLGANLDPLPLAKTYELWLIPAGEGAKPIPAGTFKPDAGGFAQVMLPDMPKGLTASKFGVTVEDEGGAEQPTLPIVMIGQ